MTPTTLPATRPSTPSADVADVLRDPMAWTVGFLLLVLVTVAGSLAMVGAMPIPESALGPIGTGMLVVAAVVLGGFVFAGTYSSVRGRGYGSAPATGLGALVLGLLALLVVVINLFLGA